MSLEPVEIKKSDETARLRARIEQLMGGFGDFDGFYCVLLRHHPADEHGATITFRQDRANVKAATLLHDLICDIVDSRLRDIELV